MLREARLYEPHAALDGGAGGCEVQRRVAGAAAAWLGPGGRLLMEIGEQQAARTADALRRGGLQPLALRDDELDATVVIATKARRP